MKTGANFLDQKKINDGFAGGLTAKEISDDLQIALGHVETYAPKKKKVTKKKVAKNAE